MAGFFQSLMQSEPHALSEVRASLLSPDIQDKSFIALLKEHHDYLEESISVIMDIDATPEEKQMHTMRFFRLVDMHGKAEEETLYVNLKADVELEARIEGFGGQDEHDIAYQLERELLEMGYQRTWNDEIAAKAKIAAGLVKNHIKEEESQMFPIAQRDLTDSQMETMRFDYVEKCKGYLDDSAMAPVIGGEYVSPDVPSLRY